MIRRLLCKVGIHEYRYWVDQKAEGPMGPHPGKGIAYADFRCCLHCSKVDRWTYGRRQFRWLSTRKLPKAKVV